MRLGNKRIKRIQYGGKKIVAAYWGDKIVWRTKDDHETYTRLTYVECDGSQWIDLDHVVRENDVIEMDYIPTYASAADKMLFAAYSSEGALWVSLYNTTAYVRFGVKSSTSVANATSKYSVKLQKEKVTFDGSDTSLSYTAMPTSPLRLFAGVASDGDSYAGGYCQCYKLNISNDGGKIIELLPYKRNSDGKAGLLDVVSGKFYTTGEESEELLAGSMLNIPTGYEVIDSVTFNNDKIYEACVIDSTYTIETMFRRSSTASNYYLYGHVTSPHSASVTAYLGSNSAWRWGSTYGNMNTANTQRHYAVHKRGSVKIDLTSKTFTASDFTTANTLAVGGYRSSSGVVTSQYLGDIYLFRIKDGDGKYILDWMPCRRMSDGVDGFWDSVKQQFVEPLK